MGSNWLFYRFIASVLLFVFHVEAVAQSLDLGKSKGRGQAEYYNSNEEKRLTNQVNLVGGVNSPGVYHFPDNTNLMEAISLAGGYLSNADLSKVYIKRNTDNGLKIYQYNLADSMQDNKDFPAIRNMDTVLIETQDTSVTSTLTLVATLLGIVSSSLLIYVTVNNLNK